MSAKNNILLHLDDPLYSVWEQKMIVRLLERSREQKKTLVVACTNRYTKDYLNSFLPSENSMIVPQGHLSDFQFDEGDDFIECTDRVFKVVYSSPYIDVKGDKHQDHDMWDSSHLLLELLPKILLFTENVELHLIGKLGRNAEKIVKGESRVVTHGLVPVSTASTLISQCHLGLYPRLADYRRSVQKITEYIGAGIPTLAYKLVDTDIVSEYRIGKVVETPEEFIASLIELSRFSEEFFGYRASVRQIRDKLCWRNIVFDMEKHLLTRNNCIS